MRKALLLLIVLLAPISSLATSMAPVTLQSLVANSDDIVRAKVLYQRTSEENGALFTHTTVKVLQPLKGGHLEGEELVIRQTGGVSGFRREGIIGDANLGEHGEEVVLVLRHDRRYHYLTNLALSKFRVLSTDEGVVLERDVGSLSYADMPGAQSPADRIPMAVLIALIEEASR